MPISPLPPLPDPDPDPEPPDKGGAPFGNHNALGHGAPLGNRNAAKHGLYSRWFTRLENKRLDLETLGELDDEENFLKITMDRLARSMKEDSMDLDHAIAAARTVGLLSGRIESIHHTRKKVYDNQTTLDKVWDELKNIPPEED